MVDLLSLYKENPSLDTKNQILKNNIGLVKSIACKYSGDFDDLCQIGLITLSRCIDKFDTSKGAFSTYATRSINNRLINHVTRDRSVKTVDAEYAEAVSFPTDFSNLEDILSKLSQKDRDVFFNYLGHKQTPNAKEYQILSKIKKLL